MLGVGICTLTVCQCENVLNQRVSLMMDIPLVALGWFSSGGRWHVWSILHHGSQARGADASLVPIWQPGESWSRQVSRTLDEEPLNCCLSPLKTNGLNTFGIHVYFMSYWLAFDCLLHMYIVFPYMFVYVGYCVVRAMTGLTWFVLVHMLEQRRSSPFGTLIGAATISSLRMR